jgi:hydrocephalus-inducing protein
VCVGLLPVKWTLAAHDKLPAEFQVHPSSGELAARSNTRITVDFKAIEKRMCEHKLVLEVTQP